MDGSGRLCFFNEEFDWFISLFMSGLEPGDDCGKNRLEGAHCSSHSVFPSSLRAF